MVAVFSQNRFYRMLRVIKKYTYSIDNFLITFQANFFRPDDLDTSFMYPFLYVHSMYSNMINKLSNSMVVSWSYYSQGEDGQMLVMRSEPKLVLFAGGPGKLSFYSFLYCQE